MAYYRCLARDRGYESCDQKGIREDWVNAQVVEALTDLEIPDNFRERVEAEVRSRVENEAAMRRMEEIQAIIERIDLRWDEGFIDREEYLEKRRQLQQEVESLRPIDYDELQEAADLIEHFRDYWEQCAQLDHPAEARQQLLAKIVDRVFAYDQEVVMIALHGNFRVILEAQEMPEGMSAVLEDKMTAQEPELLRGQHGSDGARSITCIRPLIFIAKHIADEYLHGAKAA